MKEDAYKKALREAREELDEARASFLAVLVKEATTAQVMDACLHGAIKPMEVYEAWNKQFREKPTKTLGNKILRLLSKYPLIQCKMSDEDIKFWSEHI